MIGPCADSVPTAAMADSQGSMLYSDYQRRSYRTLALYALCVIGSVREDGLGRTGRVVATGLDRSSCSPATWSTRAIGIYGRTTDADDYYVAGRRIPCHVQRYISAVDRMSAASFISRLAGGLYLQAFPVATANQVARLPARLDGGFAHNMLVAPHPWRLRLYTIPDYFGHRYGGRWQQAAGSFGGGAVFISRMWWPVILWRRADRLPASGAVRDRHWALGLGGVLVRSSSEMRAIT